MDSPCKFVLEKKNKSKNRKMEAELHFLSSGRKISYPITMENFHLKKQKLKPHRVAFLLLKNAAITVINDDNFYLEVQIQ